MTRADFCRKIRNIMQAKGNVTIMTNRTADGDGRGYKSARPLPIGTRFFLYGIAKDETGRLRMRKDFRMKTENGSTSERIEWCDESWPDTRDGQANALARSIDLNIEERDRIGLLDRNRS